jgi:hypothetical protein
MKKRTAVGAALLVLGLLVAPNAVAQDVTMQLIGAGPANMAGVYVGPYTALIEGVATPVICDSFASETYMNEVWSAHPNSYSDLSGAQWGAPGSAAQLLLYERGAWLALQMLDPQYSSQAGAIHFALWQLFDPAANPLGYLTGSKLAAANGWLQEAVAQVPAPVGAGQFSGFTVYRATGPGMCGDAPCVKQPPQEFIVRTPEPFELASLGLDLLVLGCAILLVRRRGVKRAAMGAGGD